MELGLFYCVCFCSSLARLRCLVITAVHWLFVSLPDKKKLWLSLRSPWQCLFLKTRCTEFSCFLQLTHCPCPLCNPHTCLFALSCPRHVEHVTSGRRWSWNTTDTGTAPLSTGETVSLHAGEGTSGKWPRYVSNMQPMAAMNGKCDVRGKSSFTFRFLVFILFIYLFTSAFTLWTCSLGTPDNFQLIFHLWNFAVYVRQLYSRKLEVPDQNSSWFIMRKITFI